MIGDEKNESIGAYLKRLRGQLGFTIQDISSKTKISQSYLENLENEEFASLPNDVFIKGFLRSYAKVLGLTESDVLERFQQWKQKHQASAPPAPSVSPAANEPSGQSWPHIQLDRIKSLYEGRKGFRKTLIINLLIGAVLVAGVFILISRRNSVENQLKEEEVLTSKPVPQAIPAVTAPSTAISPATSGTPPESAEKNVPKGPALHLTAEATERSWLSAVIDDSATKEFSLHPGDKISLDADKKFLLNIGNAGGLNLTLNGKVLPSYGKKGEVVKGIKLDASN